jgi:hypothetical protein
LNRLKDDWANRVGLSRRRHEPDMTRVVATVIVIGLAAWTLYTMGPELRRYMKMRSM